MSRCSEETLRVLCANKESLLTILEVFIHDPLYKWQLTSQRAQQRQKADASAPDEAGAFRGESFMGICIMYTRVLMQLWR